MTPALAKKTFNSLFEMPTGSTRRPSSSVIMTFNSLFEMRRLEDAFGVEIVVFQFSI